MMPPLAKSIFLIKSAVQYSEYITIVQLILLLPKNLWLNKIFLIRKSQNRRNLSLFIAWLVIIPFVQEYHIKTYY